MDAPLTPNSRPALAEVAHRLGIHATDHAWRSCGHRPSGHSLDSTLVAVTDRIAECRDRLSSRHGQKPFDRPENSPPLWLPLGHVVSFCILPEAVHGDLGRVDKDDILLLLSFSGETEELNRFAASLKSMAACIIAITSTSSSTLDGLQTMCWN